MSLPFPSSVLSQHIIVLGKTRAGKSSKMRLIVEQLLEHEEPVCIIDPKGDWFGLRSDADGKRAGYPVVIFGGEHADIPLNAHAGAAVAELIATGNRPSLIDLGGWMVGERTRFFIDFASTFFKLTRGRRYLVIDEVHNFAPQGRVIDVDAGKMLHWANRLASEGSGKGLTLIAASQRPQKVSKDFVTSCETLIACRVIHKLDRDAIKDWIDGCADPTIGRDVLTQLATMERPEAWVWSPEVGFGPKRITFPMFGTYDSFKPRAEEVSSKLKGWAEVDLEEVRGKLEVVVAEAQANDPAALKRRIRNLEGQLSSKASGKEEVSSDAVYKSGYDSGYGHGFGACEQSVYRQFTALRSAASDALGALRTAAIAAAQAMEIPVLPEWQATARSAVTVHPDPRTLKPATREALGEVARVMTRAVQRHDNGASGRSGTSAIDKPMPRAMLTALAQHSEGLTKRQILIHTGYRASGPVSTCFADLAREGWVSANGNRLTITPIGLSALGPFDPLPRGRDLREHLLTSDKCSTMEKTMLRALFDHYPEALSKGRILEITGYAASGPVSSAFARLVALGYAVQSGRSELRASEELFS